ncbi:MAG: hypothetical protein LJE65_14815, partial [Desulfobacteraceae bacterium]|nr:hypothetical protein [Desulfobacteraceae bacterium]
NCYIMKKWRLTVVGLLMIATVAWAGEADVLQVKVEQTGERTYTFHVTVRHADEGWDHYANGWEVLAPDGSVLGKRILYHPHVAEQPFTRSLAGVIVPEGVTEVTVRAQDSVHGTGGKTVTVAVP